MHELIVVASEIMPMEEVIDKIHDLSQTHKLTQSKESLDELIMWCVILLTKKKMKDTGKNCFETIKEYELAKKGFDLLNTRSE